MAPPARAPRCRAGVGPGAAPLGEIGETTQVQRVSLFLEQQWPFVKGGELAMAQVENYVFPNNTFIVCWQLWPHCENKGRACCSVGDCTRG